MNHVDFTKQLHRCLSFCPGIRGLERGVERVIDLRVLAHVEIEAFIIENLVAEMEQGLLAPAPIWSNLKTFKPEIFRGRVDGIFAGYPCFIAGSLILTYDGFKPIEEVKVGDKVLTHVGRWKPVTAIMRKSNAPLQRVSSQGSPSIITTPEHPFYARKLGRKWNGELGDNLSNGLQGFAWSELGSISKEVESSKGRESGRVYAKTVFRPGQVQHGWERPRTLSFAEETLEPPLGVTAHGYRFREDFLRSLGNSVYSDSAELAFRTLLDRIPS